MSKFNKTPIFSGQTDTQMQEYEISNDNSMLQSPTSLIGNTERGPFKVSPNTENKTPSTKLALSNKKKVF